MEMLKPGQVVGVIESGDITPKRVVLNPCEGSKYLEDGMGRRSAFTSRVQLVFSELGDILMDEQPPKKLSWGFNRREKI